MVNNKSVNFSINKNSGSNTFKMSDNVYYSYMNIFLWADFKNQKLINFLFKLINAFRIGGF